MCSRSVAASAEFNIASILFCTAASKFGIRARTDSNLLQVVASPQKDKRSPVKSFYLCASPVFFRPCGKIETFATAHGPEKSGLPALN